MIVSKNFNDYKVYLNKEHWGVIYRYLFQNDLANEVIGKKYILDNDITAIFLEGSFNAEYKDILEAHREHYDLHYTLSGVDIIVSKSVKDCNSIKEAYNESSDYILYEDNYDQKFEISQNTFCLISPDSAHMAMSKGCEYVKKIVFKIPIIK
ncbi:MAG: YhcH/YjgK/YiaL family protein [Flavobacterium sp.]|nr:YhcH/YjgK/YiaL family protein [Flavobacterium sp.]